MEDSDEPQAAPSSPDRGRADAAAEESDALEAYDLDGDGKVSNTEAARANLGVIDAGLQNLSRRGGIVGKLASLAHRLLDRFDND